MSFAYDALNRVLTKALPVSGSIAADTVTWAYDLAGRITSLSDTAGQSLTNAYDSAGRIVSTATAIPGLAAKTVAYAYDEASNRTRLSWPDGYNVSYAYDAANRMLSALENGTTALATFDYDQLGRPAWEQYGTGTPAAKVSFSWSNEGDLLTLTHALSGTASVSYTNAYTPAHQIASAALDNAAYRYVPQANGTDSYVPNALNQYASVTPAGGALTSIGYDLKGNLTSDGAFSFAYDAENKLITAAKTGTAASYAYDPLGRRDGKTVNGVNTYFLSADADEIAEYDGAGALLRRYVPGPAIDRPIAMVDAAGARTFFHQDKTGSVIAMSDAAGNRVEGPYLYDAFGNGAPYTGVPFKYTGRRLDPETGLYYYRARYYSSALGRFLQTDAIGYADDINWYTYVANDPTNKVDPSGLAGCGSRIDQGDIICQVGAGTFQDPRGNSGQSQQRQNSPQSTQGASAVSSQVSTSQNNSDTNEAQDKTQTAQLIEPFVNSLGARNPIIPRIIPRLAPRPSVPYPSDPFTKPAEGWQWRGATDNPQSGKGNWFNPKTGESLRYDPGHGSKGPHYDYSPGRGQGGRGQGWRWYPDGRMEPKSILPLNGNDQVI